MKKDYNSNALDVFRLIATVQVFLGHMITHFTMENCPVNAVYFVRGGPILFVICGFLAAKSLEGRSAKEWLIGRAVRIVPGFWVCIAVNTLIILMVYETKPSVIEGCIYAVTQFFGMNFYTGDWLRGYGSGTPNGVLWTIPVQIQFFLLVPLLAKMLKKRDVYRGGAIVLVLTVVSILLQKSAAFIPEIVNKLIGVTVLPYLYFLVAGMVAWYHRDSIIPALQKCKWLILLAYVLWKLMEDHWAFPHIFDGVLYNTVTTLLMAALIFAFAFCGSWRMKKDLTFGFYLYHMVFINLLLHFGVNSLEPLWNAGLLTVGIVAATCVFAWLSQRFVETPAVKRLKKEDDLMDELIRYGKKLAMRAFLTPIKLLPVKKNRVMLVNVLSKKYAGNPRSVEQGLEQFYPGEFEIVMAVNDPSAYDHLAKRGVKIVKFNSLAYFFNSLTAKVFLTNSGGFSYLPVRKSQYIINTWHGGGAYKKCGTDMYNNSELFRKDLRLQGNHTSVFLSTCKRFTEEVSRAMLVPKEVFWEIGMPRNDIMIHGDDELRREVRAKLGLKDDEKLILFAPTYRKINDNYFKDSVAISYGVDTKRVCAAMEQRFGGKWRFAMRYHPCVVNRGDMEDMGALDLTDYEDMQELMLAADAMINDFSSSMWDFMMTGRPSFLFAVDLDHYVATTEVYTPVSEWPFPQSVNNDELEKNILEFDEEKYAAACKRHYDALGGCETGKATELVCQRIYEQCFGTAANGK